MRRIIILLLVLNLAGWAIGQDPHFTQFQAAPFSVNPAYTGVFSGKVRLMTNHRQQWASAVDPFVTTSAAMDIKLTKGRDYGQNPFNIGFQFMSDKSMKGTFQSTYMTSTASFHVPLDEDGFMSLGAGLAATYASRRVDFSGIAFDAQFTSGGFDRFLPNGETSLQEMQPFMTVAGGLLFTYNSPEEGTFFEAGGSIFHLNKPQQTVLQDKNQYLPVRYSFQAGFQKYIGDQALINLRALYQSQASIEYLLGGFSISKLFGQENSNQVGIGAWYRTGDAVSPYLLLEFNKMQIACSYDITTSNLKEGPKPMRAFELSIILRAGSK